uniref:Coiled-coil domain containing 50 n=1 Tax=Neogobius melanostomus TaxID=47308 RepID=A0A8C6U3U7_9GOBI
MADCNVSIDQKNLPGVKDVCRDFAVLEDHCLAHNLQEQEIESHLASNVNKSRLVQQDLQVAKRLQEEEDLRAKAKIKRHQSDIERQDGEIAHEFQEELVRQEEQRRREQEEKDAAIARKLHEKEIKEERTRQKHVEPNFDDEYVEDQAARRPLDLDRPKYRSLSPSRHDAPLTPYQDYSPEYSSTEPKRSRCPKRDPAAPHSRSRYPDPEHSLGTESSRGRHADTYPDHLLPPRGKHRYPEHVPTDTGWSHTVDSERVVRRKEKPTRPAPPQASRDRDTGWEWDREAGWDRQYDRYERRGRQEERRHREGDPSRDRGLSADRLQDRERHRHKDQNRARTRSRDRVLDEDYYDDRTRRDRPSWEDEEVEQERRANGRRRVESNPDDVFEEHSDRSKKESRELWEGPTREGGHSHPSTETGRILHKGSGAVVAETDYRLTEVTKGLTKLDIHEQELKDREVARKLQEEELRTTSTITRAAQVAQDEEIARLLMEQEKKDYKKQREREKERQREKERDRHALDRMGADRKRQEAEYRPNSEDVVRPRTRDEYEYQRQKNHHKHARPPQPQPHEYANVNPAYSYPDEPRPHRAPSRPEPASRGAYYKR